MGREQPITKKNSLNPEDIMLSEISQREKDKYCMISLLCRISKLIKKEIILVVATGKVWRWRN